jgi:hypothetical protein
MFLSNKLLWALADHSKMSDPLLADIMLSEDLKEIDNTREAKDPFDRPVPIQVRINKETGKIESGY